MIVAVLVLLVVVLGLTTAAWTLGPLRDARRLAGVTLAATAVGLVLLAAALGLVAAGELSPLAAVTGAVVLLVGVLGGGPVTTAVLALAEGDRRPPHEEPEAAEVLRGGAWIGVLERAGILAALLSGWFGGIAVVLAVKGLGRYPNLRHPGTTERFIVGTLTSVLWAVLVGMLGRMLLAGAFL